ncbi:hypothetical protein LINGRAHAP2_LOCUS32695, partial [Linum grandiflorum]
MVNDTSAMMDNDDRIRSIAMNEQQTPTFRLVATNTVPIEVTNNSLRLDTLSRDNNLRRRSNNIQRPSVIVDNRWVNIPSPEAPRKPLITDLRLKYALSQICIKKIIPSN